MSPDILTFSAELRQKYQQKLGYLKQKKKKSRKYQYISDKSEHRYYLEIKKVNSKNGEKWPNSPQILGQIENIILLNKKYHT